MKNRKLLQSIPLIYKNAVCPSDLAAGAAQTAMDVIRSNCDAAFSHEIDSYEGTLCIWWKHCLAWGDITLPCRMLLEATRGIKPKPTFDHSIRSVSVNMRYDIPMFERNEKDNEPADGNLIRQDFAEQVENFIKRFQFINNEANGLVFDPVKNRLLQVIK
jgi:hypothetical protein